jgi:hypothetical protein
MSSVARTDRWHGLGSLRSEPQLERAQSAPGFRGLRPVSAQVVRTNDPEEQFEQFAQPRPVAPRLMPMRPEETSMTLSGMKKEIAQLKSNANDNEDRCDSARKKMDDFRNKHTFPQMCEDLKETLWPEILEAKKQITDIFEEERMETYELSQQVELLTHEKNSIAYVLYRMDQQVSEIVRIIGHR